MPSYIYTGPLTDEERRMLQDLLGKECSYKMSEAVIDEFISLGRPMELKRRQRIISAGEVNDDLFIIVSGIMRAWYKDGDQEITHAFGPPGAIVQSFHSYYEGLPSSDNFEACCPVKLLHVSRADFDALIERNADFARWNLRLAQCQLYHYEIKRRVISGTARERYEALLDHRREIVSNVPLKVIATYLGVTPEYLSKLRRIILSEWKNRR